MAEMSLEVLEALRKDRQFFVENCLKIRAKDGEMVPFVYNTAQKYVDERLDEQIKEIGMVRALILKGRQQGISTYTAGRFYHRAALRRGVNVYILSHEKSSTETLFKIVDRYQSHNPIPPHTGVSNVKELEFDRLDSSYAVATAGQKAGGRGKAISLFHGSEVAFWPNAKDHFSSSVQGVPSLPGTEVILESTANGPSGEFYERWQDAVAGKGDYIAIFVPWFWQEEYRRKVPEGFELNPTPEEEAELSEKEYAETFECDLEQMAWRRAKIFELGSIAMFNQEYPATAEMAFVSAESNNFINAVNVLKARKRKGVEGAGPLIMGVDPAGVGGDRFCIVGRRGYKVEFIEWRVRLETAEGYHWCKDMIKQHQPARVNIDAGGIGYSMISLLRDDADIDRNLVHAINFGAPSQAKKARPQMPGPKDRRAEMYGRLKEWLELEEGVSIPDMDVLQGDLTATCIKRSLTNDLVLESKQEMKARGVRSPDLADALALTFASTTRITDYKDKPKRAIAGEPDRVVAPAGFYDISSSGSDGWMM